jgi:hypothetical protein
VVNQLERAFRLIEFHSTEFLITLQQNFERKYQNNPLCANTIREWCVRFTGASLFKTRSSGQQGVSADTVDCYGLSVELAVSWMYVSQLWEGCMKTSCSTISPLTSPNVKALQHKPFSATMVSLGSDEVYRSRICSVSRQYFISAWRWIEFDYVEVKILTTWFETYILCCDLWRSILTVLLCWRDSNRNCLSLHGADFIDDLVARREKRTWGHSIPEHPVAWSLDQEREANFLNVIFIGANPFRFSSVGLCQEWILFSKLSEISEYLKDRIQRAIGKFDCHVTKCLAGSRISL